MEMKKGQRMPPHKDNLVITLGYKPVNYAISSDSISDLIRVLTAFWWSGF